MPRPRAVDTTGADTRERILRSALLVIAERGYAQTRLGDVADTAGVSLGLVQHYFGTRDGLLAAAFASGSTAALATANAIATGPGSPRERLDALVAFACSDGPDAADGSWAFWFEFWLAASREPTLALANHTYDQAWQAAFAGVIAEGTADGAFNPDAPAEAVAARIGALIDGTMLRRMLRASGSTDDLTTTIAALVGSR